MTEDNALINDYSFHCVLALTWVILRLESFYLFISIIHLYSSGSVSLSWLPTKITCPLTIFLSSQTFAIIRLLVHISLISHTLQVIAPRNNKIQLMCKSIYFCSSPKDHRFSNLEMIICLIHANHNVAVVMELSCQLTARRKKNVWHVCTRACAVKANHLPPLNYTIKQFCIYLMMI